MHTRGVPPRPLRSARLRGAGVAVAVLLLCQGSLAAQASLGLVNAQTELRSLRFRFLDHQSFSTNNLRERLALRPPGALAFLPFVSSGPFPFSPLELQRDLVRLRQFYRRSGFPNAEFDYGVEFDANANRVDVEFLVREGDPVLRGALSVLGDSVDASDLPLPPDLQPGWRTFIAAVPPRHGERVGELESVELDNRVSGWLRDRGYAFARVASELQGDEDETGFVRVALTVDHGTRARIGSIRVEGARWLTDEVILRELPFRPGDWFSAARLSQGERELFGLDLVRLALADVERRESADTLVDVRVRIQESPPRVISGQLGYATEVGLSGQLDWAHRNFLGAARTLSASVQGRTGTLGIGPDVQRRYTAALSFKQPYFYGPTRSLVVTPLVEYREDLRDRSVQGGGEAIVMQQWGTLRSVSLHFALAMRRVLDFRLTGTEGLDFRDALAMLDTLDHDVRTSTVGASLTWGRVDNAIAPRSGHLLRAGAEITGPSWVSSAQYGRIEASFARFVPFTGRTGLIVRVSGGRVLPFGSTIPASEQDKTLALLRLREALFTAGGRYDVRGWGEQLLGPKLPDVRLQSTDAGAPLSAQRYVPLGGLAKATASVEVRLPLLETLESSSAHVFLDAGRVWSPDDRFELAGGSDSGSRVSVGTGIELGTPLGPVRVSLGYKLNPSPFDVRDPTAVFAAMAAGSSVSDVPAEWSRRWHVHLTIGHAF